MTIIKGAGDDKEGDALAAIPELGRYSTDRAVLLNKTGKASEVDIANTFDAMQQASLERRLKTPDGKTILFFASHVTAKDLLDPEMAQKWADRLAEFALAQPEYVSFLQEKLDQAAGSEWHDETIKTPQDLLRSTFASLLESHKMANQVFRMRELLKLFDNPTETDDASFPVIVPIFNIAMEDMPENPVEALDRFHTVCIANKTYINRPVNELERLFSPEELSFARQCRGLVNFVNDMNHTYFTETPMTYHITAGPFFPFEVLGNRYGAAADAWLGSGCNDEIYEAYSNSYPIDI